MANVLSSALWAIVPVKPLYQTKTRLAAVLSPDERISLTRRMLRHVLTVLVDIESIERVLVVSREPTFSDIVTEFGVGLYAEHTTAGLNPTLIEVKERVGNQAAHLLVLPSDLPLLRPVDVQQVIDRTTSGAICSDRHNTGTNALLLPTDCSFRFHYGRGSFRKHQREFDQAAVPYQIIEAPGLMFDVDTPADLHMLRAANPTS